MIYVSSNKASHLFLKTDQITLASLCHEYAFGEGRKVPGFHMKGPFSCMKPSREEQPGPPLNQITKSFLPAGFTVGKNQKNMFCFSDSDEFPLRGIRPA